MSTKISKYVYLQESRNYIWFSRVDISRLCVNISNFCFHNMLIYVLYYCNIHQRYTNTAEVPRPRTSNYGKRSFRYEAAQVWNSLPNEARIMTSFDQFKKYINSWCGGQKCTCSACRIQPVLPHTWNVCYRFLFLLIYACAVFI